MAIRYGAADSGEAHGFRLTVEAPDGTSSTSTVEVGDIFKLAGTDADGGGHKIAALTAADGIDDVVLVQAMERAVGVDPMTVAIIGRYQQVRRFQYEAGNVPAVGESIVAGTDVTKVGGETFDGTSYVLYVDTDNTECEVLC